MKENVLLGHGFNNIEGKMRSKVLEVNDNTKRRIDVNSTTVEMIQLTSYAEFRRNIEAYLGLSTNFNNIAPSLRGSLKQEVNYNNFNLYCLFRIKTKTHIEQIDTNVFDTTFQEYIGGLGRNETRVPVNQEAAINKIYHFYGDEVIDSVAYGSDMSILVEIQCKSKKEQLDLQEKLGITSQWVTVEQGLGLQLSQLNESMKVKVSYKAVGREYGGIAVGMITTIGELKQLIEKFSTSNIKPAQINFTTKAYSEILDRPGLNILENNTVAIRHLLSYMARCYDKTKCLLKNLEWGYVNNRFNRDFRKLNFLKNDLNRSLIGMQRLAQEITETTKNSLMTTQDSNRYRARIGRFINDYNEALAFIERGEEIGSHYGIAYDNHIRPNLINTKLIDTYDGCNKMNFFRNFDLVGVLSETDRIGYVKSEPGLHAAGKCILDIDKLPSNAKYISWQLEPRDGISLRGNIDNIRVALCNAKHGSFHRNVCKTYRYNALSIHHDDSGRVYVMLPVKQLFEDIEQARRSNSRHNQSENEKYYLKLKLPQRYMLVSGNLTERQKQGGEALFDVNIVSHSEDEHFSPLL